jgi:4-aminobutyrate aminotransferase
MNNASIQQRRLNATPRGVGVTFDFYAQRAENATLWDVEGKAYTDFAAGIAVLNTGHRHPAVMAAVAAQLECFTHTAYQVVPYESAVALAERINAAAPIAGPAKTAFFTTGAEAVENAVKIARCATGRPGVIAFAGAFHGRTLMGMALTGKVAPYKLGFGPFPSDVYHVPFPSELHGVSVRDSLKAIEQLFKADIDPSRVAAIIIEPVQGEGGFNVAPPALMEGLRAICDEHGIMMIADEIQTGFGRTGKLFAMEHCGVQPDLVTMAKSLSGGLPLSAVCGRAKVMDAPAPGGLGGTYAANPLAVAASHAVFDTIEKEGLLQRSTQLGAKLRAFLQEQRQLNASIADVRGLGSMCAVEFGEPDGTPNPAMAQRVQQLAMHRGLILLTCGVHANVIRFLYPLTIPEAQFDAALEVLAEALGQAAVPVAVA